MAATLETSQQPSIDGRTARRQRGRIAVTDAMLELILESGVPPTTTAIASRAGVSAASLFRYFDTLDDLADATAKLFYSRYADLFEIPDIGEGPLAGRIESYIATRVRLYETMANMARLVRHRAFDNLTVERALRDQRTWFAEQAMEHFGNELHDRAGREADAMVVLIATITSFESWDQARHDHDRGPNQLRQGWTTGLSRLLAP